MSDGEGVDRAGLGVAALGVVLRIYPEIAKAVGSAKAAGALSESTLAAIERADPAGPSVLDDARTRIAALPDKP